MTRRTDERGSTPVVVAFSMTVVGQALSIFSKNAARDACAVTVAVAPVTAIYDDRRAITQNLATGFPSHGLPHHD